MNRVPIIDSDGVVINVIVFEEGAAWEPPENCAIGAPGGEIGDVWNGSAYDSPEVTE